MGTTSGEDFVAGLGDQDVVFYSDAELAGDVYAGFDSDYLAGFEFAFGVGFEERGFVDFQAEAVSGAVAVDGQIGLGDCLASGGVNFGERSAGSDLLYRRGLGLLHNVEDSRVKHTRLADRKAPCNIAAIAFVP